MDRIPNIVEDWLMLSCMTKPTEMPMDGIDDLDVHS